VVLAGLVAALTGCVGTEKPDLVGAVDEFTIDSALVNDGFRIWVRLPREYDGVQRFPLVVQLDANLPTLEEFNVTAGFAGRLEDSGDISPVIIAGVGVDYDPYTARRGRQRDFTLPLEHDDTLGGTTSGGAPEFLRFLGEELMPALEAKYQLLGPEHRALFGHSLGGLFATYAFSQQDESKRLFQGYVAASPTLLFDGGTIFRYVEALFARTPDPSAVFLLTAGTMEGPEMNVYADDFADQTTSRGATRLVFQSARYSTDHLGSVQPSFIDGLALMAEQGVTK
jgi:predicted alpha/beta superfamily hydrolase